MVDLGKLSWPQTFFNPSVRPLFCFKSIIFNLKFSLSPSFSHSVTHSFTNTHSYMCMPIRVYPSMHWVESISGPDRHTSSRSPSHPCSGWIVLHTLTYICLDCGGKLECWEENTHKQEENIQTAPSKDQGQHLKPVPSSRYEYSNSCLYKW